jgi:hypothetical protein
MANQVHFTAGNLLAVQLLFFLRYVQLGATVITGFITCLLIWKHNNHICSVKYYGYRVGRYCTPQQRANAEVPSGLWIMLVTVTLPK